MEEFKIKVNETIVNDVIFSIQALMNGVNMNFMESVIGIFHRRIMNEPLYVKWVVSNLFNYEMLTPWKFSKLLETNKWQITPEHVLCYYRHELQYELNRNRSNIAKKVNELKLEQEKLNKFVSDYRLNYQQYDGSKLANVLDKPELFRYIQEFLKI